MKKIALIIFSAAVALGASVGHARWPKALRDVQQSETVVVPSAGQIEVGFSPEGSARELVLRVINTTKPGSSIRMMAYAFTASDIVEALIERRKAGVDIAIVVDQKMNLTGSGAPYGRSALNALVNAGISVRTISVYPISHDKTIVAGSNVQWGSFNYTRAAEKYNSENATVAWNNPGLAKVYLQHWKSRWDQGIDYKPAY